MKNKFLKSLSLIFCLGVVPVPAFCQKLPNVQTTSLPVPKAIKIDGKPTEWNNGFEAYNRSTDLYYSVANDSKNIYLVIQATDLDIVKKILKGGITIMINPVGKKRPANSKSINFPMIGTLNENTLLRILLDMQDVKGNPVKSDSATRAFNSALYTSSNEIKLNDPVTYKDSLISIYNDQGISVAGALGSNLALTYEFKIPFNLLAVNYVRGSKIYYNVQLSAKPNYPPKPANMRPLYYTAVPINSTQVLLSMPTDFWGEYTVY